VLVPTRERGLDSQEVGIIRLEMKIALHINGAVHTTAASPGATLLGVRRDEPGLLGTRSLAEGAP
jgi:hypothetical protein